jgi:hypothetical protein
MTEIGKVDPAAWGIYETRQLLTREIIQMFGLKGDKAARMRTHLKGVYSADGFKLPGFPAGTYRQTICYSRTGIRAQAPSL